MKITKKSLILCCCLIAIAFIFTGCGSKTNSGNSIGNDIGNAVDNVGNDVGNMVDDAGNIVDDAADGAGNMIKDVTNGTYSSTSSDANSNTETR